MLEIKQVKNPPFEKGLGSERVKILIIYMDVFVSIYCFL